jgi:regulator of sigma E protease
MSIFIGILGLAVLILIHEAGHFYVARAVGMRPRKFYVGFPPALVKTTRKGIEYGLGAIPLGGYVKIPGMHRPAPSDLDAHLGRAVHEAPELSGPVERMKALLAEGDMDAARPELPALEEVVRRAELSAVARRSAERGLTELRDALGSDAYWRQRTWKKVAVIFAGPATNLVFAVALLAAVFMIGIPVDTTREVAEVDPTFPAAQVGLREGDRIVAVNDRPVEPDLISATIRDSGGRPLRLTVERGGERVELRQARPRVEELSDGSEVYRLGFRLEPRYESYGLVKSIELASRETWEVTVLIGESLGRIATGDRDEVSSPVGITQASSQALEAGFRYYLQVLALISLSLALLNLLPLLPLDGGHITFSIIEGVRGKALGRPVYERVSMIGLIVVLFLFVTGLTNDISRLNGG